MSHTGGAQRRKEEIPETRRSTPLTPEDKRRIAWLMMQGWSLQDVSKKMGISKPMIKANWRSWAEMYGVELPASIRKSPVDRSPGEVKTYFVEPSPEKKKKVIPRLYIPGVYTVPKAKSSGEEETDSVEKLIGSYRKDGEDDVV